MCIDEANTLSKLTTTGTPAMPPTDRDGRRDTKHLPDRRQPAHLLALQPAIQPVYHPAATPAHQLITSTSLYSVHSEPGAEDRPATIDPSTANVSKQRRASAVLFRNSAILQRTKNRLRNCGLKKVAELRLRTFKIGLPQFHNSHFVILS